MGRRAAAIGDDETRFRALFGDHYRSVLAYALRRASRADADDLVAETFTVAWRRLADLPTPEYQLAWLYAIAARVLANQRRAQRRRAAFHSRLRGAARVELSNGLAARLQLRQVIAALETLRAGDQEILRLVAWEGLTQRQLALVLDCSERRSDSSPSSA